MQSKENSLKSLWLIITLIMVVFNLSNAQNVNGERFEVEDKTILKVWGTHYERGYAHGYLMAHEIKLEIENFFIGSLFGNDTAVYSAAREYFLANFTVERKYQDEVHGIFAGMDDSGIDLYCQNLDRRLEPQDIYAFTAFTDLVMSGLFGNNDGFGCSTLSDWGESTEDDEMLQGNLVVARALDGHMDQVIISNHTLIVHFPSEESEIPWVNICFPGMVATFSCFNRNGIGAFQNYGGYNIVEDQENLHPVMLAIRNGIEMNDYNGDDESDHYDVCSAIQAENSLSAWIITAVSAVEAVIVEINNNLGSVVRTEDDNTIIPEDNIAATNHYRVLRNPVNCSRYSGITDSLENNLSVTLDRNWEILRGAAGINSNTHFIQYAPSLNLLKWASAPDRNTPGYSQEPTEFDIEELFSHPLSTQDRSSVPGRFDMVIYPNPFNESAIISYSLSRSRYVAMRLFDLEGRMVNLLTEGFREAGRYNLKIDAGDLASGVYFIRLEGNNISRSQKLILVR